MLKKIFLAMLTTLVVAMGGGGNVLMATSTGDSLADGEGGASSAGSAKPANTAAGEGVASVTTGQQNAPEMYQTDLEQAIFVLDPMGTAGLTLIETDAVSRKIEDQEFEFYSIGPRIIRTTIASGGFSSANNLDDRAIITVNDKGFAAKDDTIRVVGVAGNDGRDLMLLVIEKDTQTGGLVVYAKNGFSTFTSGTPSGEGFKLPSISAGTTLVRMAKACSESKAQTARANAYPSSEKGCVQNFMLQIEQTEFDKMTKKRVSWDFNDIVDWNMRDYKVVKELTYFFSIGGLDRHDSNELEDNYTMLGIWWQAGRDLEIGHIATDASGNTLWEEGPNGEVAEKATSATAIEHHTETFSGLTTGNFYYVIGSGSSAKAISAVAKVEIDGKDLVRFNKDAFVGNGGSQIKYLIAGANVVEAFDNIKGKQYENKDIVTENNLTVQNFKTSFGTIKLVYDKLFDICGMANAAFMLDKQYLRKVDFMSMTKTQLELKKSGQRNSSGVVLQEVNAIYLQYADAHARVWLAGRTNVYDYTIASRYDKDCNKAALVGKASAHTTDRRGTDYAAYTNAYNTSVQAGGHPNHREV